jgi:hypothetical protein
MPDIIAAIPCPSAEPAILGFINGTYNKWFGENVTYACDAGHDILHGDLERVCLANGTWSGSPPECARKLPHLLRLRVSSIPCSLNGMLNCLSYDYIINIVNQ